MIWADTDLSNPYRPRSGQVRSTFYGCRTGQLTRWREFSGLAERRRPRQGRRQAWSRPKDRQQ
jgi:hypothetical protein